MTRVARISDYPSAAALSFVLLPICASADVIVARNEASRSIAAIRVCGDSGLKLSARLEAGPVEKDLDSNVTSNLGGLANVVCHEDDSITVEFPK